MTSAGRRGFALLAHDRAVSDWAAAARRAALRVVAEPEMRARWLQCEGTWFVGVDALPNGPDGAVDGVPLPDGLKAALGPLPPLHAAQVSVVYPGYPRPRQEDSAAAFAYRQRRDGAHVDGLLPGAGGARHLVEPHAFILGLPLTDCSPEASPLVVWEGSHEIIRAALSRALADVAEADIAAVDISEAYKAARREIFETCRRVCLHARPGEAILLHRLALHGIAPWAPEAMAPPEGRMVAYFRPMMAEGARAWLTAP